MRTSLQWIENSIFAYWKIHITPKKYASENLWNCASFH